MINYGRNYLLLVHEHDEKSFPNLIFSPKILHKSASWRGSLQAQVANQHQSTELDQICVIRTCERKLHENCTNIASYGRKLHKNCAHCIGRKMRRNCAKNCAQDTVRPRRGRNGGRGGLRREGVAGCQRLGVNAEAEQEAQEDAPGEDEEGGGYGLGSHVVAGADG